MSHPILPSYFPITTRGAEVQRQHAQRLLLSGFDVESAAMLSGLQLDEVRAIAEQIADESAAL